MKTKTKTTREKVRVPSTRRRHPALGEGKPSLLSNPAIGKAAAALAAYEGAKQLWNSASSLYREHLVYTVLIDETDHAYADVHEWLLTVLPTDGQRSLVASTVSRRELNFLDEDEAESKVPAAVRLSFNDRKSRRIEIDGHRVSAKVTRVEDMPDTNAKKVPMAIEFTARTKAGQDAVVRQLQRIQEAKGARKPVLRIVNQWGNWARRSDLPLRDLESVVLPKEQKDSVVEDLRAFLAAEDRYVKLALPWHRGYMFHGPPGTGKTSLVKALANEFKLDLWYVSLGDLKEEASLINLLSDVSPRSILLLEDVDTIQLTHDRDEEPRAKSPTSISLSSLLNALDGVATPHGLITVMTTNHFDRLDPALTRAGRMDRVEELAYPGTREVDDLYRRFFGAPLPSWSHGDATVPMSQAEVSEVFKRHLDDPEGAARALFSALEGREW